MQHLFEPPVYQERRRALATAMESGVILISGNEESPMNYAANVYRYRQDSNFLYYGGLNIPGLNLIIDIDAGETTLYGDEITVEEMVWTGPRESLASMAGRVGISNVRPADHFLKDCRGRQLQCLPPYRTEHYRTMQMLTQDAKCSVAPSQKLIRAVVAQRECKEDREVEQMENALNITEQMHHKVMRSARAGMRESVLAGIAKGIALANQGDTAYGIIISRNGHILHNRHHDNILKAGDLVLGDFGAENAMCYASDITRTFPVDHTFSTQQRDLYQIVLEAQVKAINAVRPGQLFRDVHLLSAKIIADGLRSLKIMKGNADDAVEAGAHALFFPHGLGHMIGLDVHDMEGLGEDFVGYDAQVRRSDQFGLGYLRMAKTLVPGYVVTVEPGIYFIPQLIEMWEEDKKFADFIDYDVLRNFKDAKGIRIEDNVLVTENGNRVLGPKIPKTVKDVESLRKKA